MNSIYLMKDSYVWPNFNFMIKIFLSFILFFVIALIESLIYTFIRVRINYGGTQWYITKYDKVFVNILRFPLLP